MEFVPAEPEERGRRIKPATSAPPYSIDSTSSPADTRARGAIMPRVGQRSQEGSAERDYCGSSVRTVRSQLLRLHIEKISVRNELSTILQLWPSQPTVSGNTRSRQMILLGGIQSPTTHRTKTPFVRQFLLVPLLTTWAFAFLSFEGTVPGSASLASQPPPHPLVMLAKSDGVLSGVVLEKVVLHPEPETCPDDVTTPLHYYQVRCRVVVDRVWKGAPPDTVSILAEDSPSKSRMGVGETCLIFYRKRGDELVGLSWGGVPLMEVAHYVEKLDLIPNSLDSSAADSAIVEVLVRELDTEIEYEIRRATSALLSVDQWKGIAIPRLVDFFSSTGDFQLLGFHALTARAGDDPRISAMILNGLEDADPALRRASLKALSRGGPGEFDGNRVVKRALVDPDAGVRAEALDRLVDLSSDDFDRHGAISIALSDPDSTVRRAAVRSTKDNLTLLEEQVALMRIAMADSCASIRRAALGSQVVHTLNKWERAASPFVDGAFGRLTDTDPLVRAAAVNFLREIGDVYPNALPRLYEATEDPSSKVREMAFNALHYYSKDTPGLVRRFVRGLSDPHKQVRSSAAEGLTRCHTSTWGSRLDSPEPWPDTVVPALRIALDDEYHGVGRHALEALIALLPDKEVMEILLEAMTNTTATDRDAGGHILAQLVERSQGVDEAIELTHRAMSGPARRERAFRIAGYFAEVDEGLEHQILFSVDDPNRDIRMAAVAGIAEMSPFLAESDSLLRYMALDVDERVRRKAELNLKWITTERDGPGNRFESMRKKRTCQLPPLADYSRRLR